MLSMLILTVRVCGSRVRDEPNDSLTYRRSLFGSVEERWSTKPESLRFDSSLGLRISHSLSQARDKTKTHNLQNFIKACSCFFNLTPYTKTLESRLGSPSMWLRVSSCCIMGAITFHFMNKEYTVITHHFCQCYVKKHSCYDGKYPGRHIQTGA